MMGKTERQKIGDTAVPTARWTFIVPWASSSLTKCPYFLLVSYFLLICASQGPVKRETSYSGRTHYTSLIDSPS